jgi:RNase adaptor protein for sRNA GlmZ degradation
MKWMSCKSHHQGVLTNISKSCYQERLSSHVILLGAMNLTLVQRYHQSRVSSGPGRNI